jgi:DNA-binding FadR family transcriptional regulator
LFIINSSLRGDDVPKGERPRPGPATGEEPPALRRDDWERTGAGSHRAMQAAAQITALAGRLAEGERLGTKEELRARCGVSVGTFNETLRLLQARGVVSVRPGPGGGLFAASPPPMVRLGNSVLALDAEPTNVADAVRVRDALDPLLVEDALWHGSPADFAELRKLLPAMETAAEEEDAIAFVKANWQLHAQIAAISPNTLLRSLYGSLLDLIESHTLSVLPSAERPLAEYIRERYELHAALVAALEARDREAAIRLTAEHNTTANRDL